MKVIAGLIASIFIFLAGCGGGGGGGGGGGTGNSNSGSGGSTNTGTGASTTQAGAIEIQPNATLFAQLPLLLPDMYSRYKTLCLQPGYTEIVGPNYIPNVQSGAAANVMGHKDGKKDLAFTFWCGLPGGTPYDGETPSGGVIFKQNTNGTFTEATNELTGKDLIGIKGVAWKPLVYDFSGDGYEEIIWPVQGEDGRAQQPVYRQSVFLTSKNNGKYDASFKGSLIENAGQIALVDNNIGGKDVITNLNYWRFENTWKEYSGYDWYRIGTVFMPKNDVDMQSNYAVRPWGLDLELYNRTNQTDTWSFSDRYSLSYRLIPFISWQKKVGQTYLVTMNGNDYIQPQYEIGCSLKLNPSEKAISFHLLNAGKLDKKYVEGSTYTEGKGSSPAMFYKAFSLYTGKLLEVAVNIPDWKGDTTAFSMDCVDVNGDGYDDIVISSGGSGDAGKPYIYINDKKNGFKLIDRALIPAPPKHFSGAASFVKDIDGDGISDLIYWPLNLDFTNLKAVNFLLYKGIKALQ